MPGLVSRLGLPMSMPNGSRRRRPPTAGPRSAKKARGARFSDEVKNDESVKTYSKRKFLVRSCPGADVGGVGPVSVQMWAG